MNNPDGASASSGRTNHNPKADGTQPLESGVLPDDFGQRLERLKEASGLSWRGLARALGADPKQLARWRKGVEPCGGAMHSIHRFASRMPGGTDIVMGEDYQMSFFEEEEEDDVDVARGPEGGRGGGRPGRLDPRPRRAQAQRRRGGV